ncbi:MAG: hypothetical protein KAI83_03120 [Thiomargarita sp.]|nr:hypothetical protein [Thiomargarita sp.]
MYFGVQRFSFVFWSTTLQLCILEYNALALDVFWKTKKLAHQVLALQFQG